jgi:hypothetical protein
MIGKNLQIMSLSIKEENRNSEKLIDFLINNVPGDAVVIDTNSKIKKANRNFLLSNSLSRRQIIGESCFDVKCKYGIPCLRDNNSCPLKMVFQINKSVRFKHPNSSQSFFKNIFSKKHNPELHAVPIYGDNGDVSFITEVIYGNYNNKINRNKPKFKLNREIQNQIWETALSHSKNGIYTKILELIIKIMDSNYGVFLYVDKQGKLVCPANSKDPYKVNRLTEKKITIPNLLWLQTLRRSFTEKKTLCIKKPFYLAEIGFIINNAMIVPIVYDEKAIGLIITGDKKVNYSYKDRKLLNGIADYIAPILNNLIENQVC